MALNQPLYDALVNSFRDVGIVHEGEPRKVRYSPDYSRPGKLKAQVTQHGEGYSVNCPFCDDRRQRLTVNHHFGVPDPKTGSRNQHLLHCFNEKCHNVFANQTVFYKRLRDAGYRSGRVTYSGNANHGDSEPRKSDIRIPKGTIPLHELPSEHPAYLYLKQRRFDPVELAIRWSVGYCENSPDTTPDFSERIVIPIYAVTDNFTTGDGHLDITLAGWQARAIEDIAYGDRKYLFQDGLQTSRLLYGLHEAIHSGGPIVLCEGVTDCWRIGPGALAIFGKKDHLSRDQIRLLNTYVPGRPIVVLLDRDARHEANELRQQLRTARSGLDGDCRVVVANLPEGRDDPGDASRKELLETISDALGEHITTITPSSSYSILNGAAKQFSKLGLDRLGNEVAIAYVTDDTDQLTGIAVAGEDRKLQFVATGFKKTIGSLGDRHQIYHDAVKARAIELRNQLAQQDDFDDVRTMQRLVAYASPEVHQQTTDSDLLNSAHSATTGAVKSGLTEVAETRAVWDAGIYQQRISELGLDYVYREIELPVIDATAAMMTNGVRVDVELLRQRLATYIERICELEKQMRDVAGTTIDLNDDNAIARYLYDELELEIPYTTRGGQASVDKHALKSLSRQHAAVPLIRKYRQTKVLVNASSGLLNSVDPESHRVHCHLDPLGAATGRYSCESPNLQGLPRQLRDVFVAEDGHLLIEADFSQIELRVLAHFSKDPALIEAFLSDDDLHRRTASLVFDVAEDQVTDRQRDVGKRINFAIIYGETEYGLARDLGVSEFQAEEFIERYLAGYAGVQQWIKTVHTTATKNGYVSTLYGRRRQLPDILSSDQFKRERGLRQAVNTIIQGTAADINKMAIARLYRQLPSDCRMLLTVHDSILLEVPEKTADQIACDVKQIMENGLPDFTVPVVVDVHTGRNWGDCKQNDVMMVQSP